MSDDREQRNQVFAQQQAALASGIQVMTEAEKLKVDFGIDIPNEVVPLPSGGTVYPQNSSLFGRETVDIKAMSAHEEDILTSKALLKKGTIITELIRSCMIDKTINPTDLLTGDRNALMIAIRITGYGQEYDAEVQCNECDAKQKYQFNLAALPIKRLEIAPVQQGSNLFEFKLPATGLIVRFKFLTGRDEEDISTSAERNKKLNLSNSENTITSTLLHNIVSINSVEDRAKIANFVKKMPARDSLALRTYIKDNEPGIIMKQEITCSACGAMEEVMVPLGVSFLWPGAGR